MKKMEQKRNNRKTPLIVALTSALCLSCERGGDRAPRKPKDVDFGKSRMIVQDFSWGYFGNEFHGVDLDGDKSIDALAIHNGYIHWLASGYEDFLSKNSFYSTFDETKTMTPEMIEQANTNQRGTSALARMIVEESHRLYSQNKIKVAEK